MLISLTGHKTHKAELMTIAVKWMWSS